jgi:aldose 1-epimerase
VTAATRCRRLAPAVAPDGRSADAFALEDGAGVQARVLALGASLVGLDAPDGAGRAGPVVLELASPAAHFAPHPFVGATIGRYANRIANARFRLGAREFALAANDGANHLHGGPRGFQIRTWSSRPVDDGERAGVRFEHASADGEEGYPGALAAGVTYWLGAAGELAIDLRATSDRPTVVNLTHHGYWNLRDGGAGDVLGHELEIDAPAYTPVDAAGIPTGEIRPVEGTPFDFRRPRAIGERIETLVAERGGYDHNFVLSPRGPEPRFAARLRDAASGRALEVWTTQPGLQIYTANRFDGSLAGPAGRSYHRWCAICLEPQHFPDSPNRPDFPSTTLRPGEIYAHRIVYRLSAGPTPERRC